MKKLLLASVLAIATLPGYARPFDSRESTCEKDEECAAECLKVAETKREIADCRAIVEDDKQPSPPARVTVQPPYQGPPPIGWVYGPYTQCANPPQCSMGVVNVGADGLNVRVTPNGPAIMSLVNGTPLYPVGREGPWLLVAPACDLTPTWVWSWNAGVPLNRCWVYF
jgi:hypothetical protein